MIQTILFDFDGTLFDTGEGILRSVQYALEGFGIHAVSYTHRAQGTEQQ